MCDAHILEKSEQCPGEKKGKLSKDPAPASSLHQSMFTANYLVFSSLPKMPLLTTAAAAAPAKAAAAAAATSGHCVCESELAQGSIFSLHLALPERLSK